MNARREVLGSLVVTLVCACSSERPNFGGTNSSESSNAMGDAGHDAATSASSEQSSSNAGIGTSEASSGDSGDRTPSDSKGEGTAADAGKPDGDSTTDPKDAGSDDTLDTSATTDAASDGDGGSVEPGCRLDGCDDGLACNGVEECVNGRCESGEPPCAASAGCSPECEESNNGPECSERATDADGDGEGSTQCLVSPGLDCNDEDDAIFSSAQEACDGLDQDCDGLDDMDEGFELTGEVLELPVGTGGILGAWSQELGTFALAEWYSSTARFRTVNLNGEASEPITLDGVGDLGFRGELASGHGRFALVSPRDFGQFNLIDATGLLEFEEPSPLWGVEDAVRDVAVVATESGWLSLFTLNTSTSAPQGRRFNAEGEALEPSALTVGDLTDTPDGIEAAVLGDEVGVVWDHTDGVYFSRYSDDLIKFESRSLSSTGRSSDIAAGSDGYAVAWFESDFSLMFMQLNAEGEVVCGPTDMGVSLELNQQPHLSVAPYAGGYAVLYSDNASTRVHLLRVHDGCDGQLPAETVQQPSQSNKNDIRLSGDASGLIATWRDGPADPRYRVLGGALCNQPDQ